MSTANRCTWCSSGPAQAASVMPGMDRSAGARASRAQSPVPTKAMDRGRLSTISPASAIARELSIHRPEIVAVQLGDDPIQTLPPYDRDQLDVAAHGLVEFDPLPVEGRAHERAHLSVQSVPHVEDDRMI